MTQSFVNKGFDSATALNQAYGAIKGVVRREALVMAYNDAFLFVGLGLALGAGLIWFCRPARAKAGAAAH